MNPANFVDSMGNKIYFVGKYPSNDLRAFLQVFIDIGVDEKELRMAIKIKSDEKGVYITQDSYIPKAKEWNLDTGILADTFVSNTTNLKNNLKTIFRRMETIFTKLIQADDIIEFSLDTDAFYGRGKINSKGWIKSDTYGRGVFIDSDSDLKKNSKNPSKGNNAMQIIIDPNPKNPEQLLDGEFHVDLRGHTAPKRLSINRYYALPMTLEATIAHEFGHAYAAILGHKDDGTHTSLFAEVAVLLENLYRLRAIEKIWKGKTPRSHQYVRIYH
jgi:hypothetical protein